MTGKRWSPSFEVYFLKLSVVSPRQCKALLVSYNASSFYFWHMQPSRSLPHLIKALFLLGYETEGCHKCMHVLQTSMTPDLSIISQPTRSTHKWPSKKVITIHVIEREHQYWSSAECWVFQALFLKRNIWEHRSSDEVSKITRTPYNLLNEIKVSKKKFVCIAFIGVSRMLIKRLLSAAAFMAPFQKGMVRMLYHHIQIYSFLFVSWSQVTPIMNAYLLPTQQYFAIT